MDVVERTLYYIKSGRRQEPIWKGEEKKFQTRGREISSMVTSIKVGNVRLVRLSDPDRELVLESITRADEESEPGKLKFYRLNEPVASFHKDDINHWWYDKVWFEEVAE